MVSAIFDLDGTLLDTEPVYLDVEGSIVARYGGDIRELTPQLLGTVPDDAAKLVINHYKLDMTPEEYLEERNAKVMAGVRDVKLLPGVEKLIQHLVSHDIKISIATSSSSELLAAKMHAHPDLFALFPTIVCADDVKRGKPDPEIFLLAAERMGEKPEKCIVFEDAPAGVQAAASAGMRSVGLKNEFTAHSSYSQADILLHSLLDFEPASLGFPPY